MERPEISHTGKVLEINPQLITVEIMSESACAACHARTLCSLGDSKKKTVYVPTPLTEFYEVGEEVNVLLKASMGHKAVWLAYAVPLVVLFASLMLCNALGRSELFCGLCGIAAVLLYYFLIFLFRERLRNEYVFQIQKRQ